MFIIASTEFPLELSDISDDNIAIENDLITIIHAPNDTNDLCYKKYCVWHNTYSYIIPQYSNFILTNDSIIITRDLNDFEKLFNSNIEITGLLASNEYSYHYPDFLRRYNPIGVHKAITYYNNNLGKYHNCFELVLNLEIRIMDIFKQSQRQVLFDIQKDHSCNIHFHEICMSKYLFHLNYPIIKVKALIRPWYYLHNTLPTDFNCDDYKELNPDLSFYSVGEYENHFITRGMYQARMYKKEMKSFLKIYCTTLKNYVDSNDNLSWIIEYIRSIATNTDTK
jgi:hypothetical protein